MKKTRARGGRHRRRSRRPASRRRQAVIILVSLTIPAGLFASVRRTADGTRLAEEIGELQDEERLLNDLLSDETMRVDSLSSRQRIAGAARSLGLREAGDHEVLHLVDVTNPNDAEDGGS